MIQINQLMNIALSGINLNYQGVKTHEGKLCYNLTLDYNEIDYIKESGTAGFMTEASFVEENRIILGPGPVTAHEINEYVTIESLAKAVKQYKELIKINCCK